MAPLLGRRLGLPRWQCPKAPLSSSERADFIQATLPSPQPSRSTLQGPFSPTPLARGEGRAAERCADSPVSLPSRPEAESQIPTPPWTPEKLRLRRRLGAQMAAAAGCSCAKYIPFMLSVSTLGRDGDGTTGKHLEHVMGFVQSTEHPRGEKKTIRKGKDISEHLCTWPSAKAFVKPVRVI
ncbi:uncharacterized protein LOC142364154 isoform X2 [Opisthocomus hoazin]